MRRGSEQKFFQRRHTDGKQAHEKAFNITNHQENANQKHNEILPHIGQNIYHQENKIGVGKDENGKEKRESMYTVGGNVNWFKYCGEQYGDFSKSEK